MKPLLSPLVIAASVMVASCLAAATQEDALGFMNETWRLPLDIDPVGQFKYLPTSGDSNNILFAADTRGVLFGVDASNGRILWSFPGQSGIEEVHVNEQNPDLLFLHYSGGTFEALNSKTGDSVWSTTAPVNTSFTDSALLSASVVLYQEILSPDTSNPYREIGRLIKFNSQTGDVIFNSSVKSQLADTSYWMSASEEAIVLGFDGVGLLISYDATNGDQKCTFSGKKNTIYLPPGIFAGRYGYIDAGGDDHIYDLLTCKVAMSAKIAGFHTIIKILHNKWYFFHTEYDFAKRTGDTQWYVALMDIGQTAPVWNISLPKYDDLMLSPQFPGNLPYNSGALSIIVNLRIGAYNASTGAMMWHIDEPVPQNVFGPYENLVYPLGNEAVFFPNLQGFTVYNPKKQMVLARNEYKPIAGTVPFAKGLNGNPFVVWAEAETGDLVAAHYTQF